MAGDAPDWVIWQQTVVTVDVTPVAEEAANETPVSKTEGKVTNSDQTYQTLATWTVTSTKVGVLYGVELYASNFSKTHFKLTIGGVVKWTDKELPAALNINMANTRLPASTVVLVEGKSNDGTSVDMWAHIEGKELG